MRKNVKPMSILLILVFLLVGCNFNDSSITSNNTEHTHINEGEWSSDATHHWLACTCGENVLSAEHIWDDEIEVEGGNGAYVMEFMCSVCGEKYQEIITITPLSYRIHSYQ